MSMGKLINVRRLTSLDAFRGATIALMVLVNTPGDGDHTYAALQHAEWHGWTLTDTVFPSFAWIIGVAITLALGRRIEAGVSRGSLFRTALRRAAILFALGLFLYGFPHFDLSTQRVLGVLQRLAICYLAASAIYLTSSVRGIIAWTFGLLAGYWLLMMLVPVPGYGAGRLDVEGNLAHYVDRIVLGSHNYRDTKTWDPEGIVSTLPAIATTLLGVLAGLMLKMQRSLERRTLLLAGLGVALLAAGLVCDQWLPINKKLWTTSFTLFMAGWDFVVFAAFVWVMDIRGWQAWATPLKILGMNAVAAYMISELLIETLNTLGWRRPLYETLFLPLASPVNASLLFAVAYVALIYTISWAMYRKGWFLRV